MRLCFVTCRTWPEISESDRLVQRALEARGATVEPRGWNDAGAGWDGFDAIVLRSNWDYHFEPDAFLGWLDRRERAGARVFNPPALVRWNLTKAYLLELAQAGVPTVATVILEDETRAGLEAVMAAREHPERKARAAGDNPAIIRLSGEFHVLMAEIAGNTMLARTMRELTSLTCLIIALYDSPAVPHCRSDEHAEIVDAIAAGDKARATRLMVDHLNHVEQGLDLNIDQAAAVDLEQALA